MDLWQLKIFCKVVELRSFSKAGEAIHLSQPTVSSHIKDLEDHFGTKLVDRLSRQTLPTKAGELLYNYARRMIALRDETESTLADFLGQVKGRLTIGGSTIPGGYLLPRLIGLFCKRHPNVQIAMRVGDTTEIIRYTIAGRVELSVVGAGSENKQIEQTPLINDELRVVIPADHKWVRRKHVALNELLSEPFIVRESGSGTLYSLAKQLHEKGIDIDNFNVVAELGSTEAVRQGIKSHVGVSILSAIAVADDVKAGTLITLPLEGLQLNRSFYLITHRQRSLSPLCRNFYQFLQQKMPQVYPDANRTVSFSAQ